MEVSEYPERIDNDALLYAKQVLFYALYIGEQMLLCGAEVGRVEDSIRRICKAYGAEQVDVFTITSSIVATIYGEKFGSATQTRRIEESHKNNLNRIYELNALSRQICATTPPLTEVAAELHRIEARTKPYPLSVSFLMFVLAPLVFSLFFGGGLRDALCAGVIGAAVRLIQLFFERFPINRFVATFLSSVISGVFSNLSAMAGISESADLVSIGVIMLLIPGMALTHAARDIFSGDTISGLLRFVEVILVAASIAVGFAIAGLLTGLL